MPNAQPQTISNQLSAKLEGLYLVDGPLNVFDLKMIGRDADTLAQTDAASANIIKAGVAALLWDRETAKDFIEKACKLDYSARTLFNGAMNFKFFNDFETSASYLRKAVLVSPNDLYCFTELVSVLVACGFFQEALSVCELGAKRGLDIQHGDTIRELVACMQRIGVTEERMVYEIRSFVSVLTENKVRRRDLDWLIDTDPDGGEFLLGTSHFGGTFESEMKFEAQLANLLAAEPGWNPNKLAIELNHREVNALHAA